MRAFPNNTVLLVAFTVAGWWAEAEMLSGRSPNPHGVSQASHCACDPARPETLEARECSLCREAEKQPPGVMLFFLKDNHPRKPNRWLALPRLHSRGMHDIAHLNARQRAEFWKATIRKARALWGDQWGLAINGDKVRTQCHAHVHIGKLLEHAAQHEAALTPTGAVAPGNPARSANGPGEIPVPQAGQALWIHPKGKKLHVHVEDRNQATEFVLRR